MYFETELYLGTCQTYEVELLGSKQLALTLTVFEMGVFGDVVREDAEPSSSFKAHSLSLK